MSKQLYSCKDCGWKGAENELNYCTTMLSVAHHLDKPLTELSCPTCGSKRLSKIGGDTNDKADKNDTKV
jgi:DNA-directed RNA polymerase subunit RPC12/RpoP